MKEMTTIQISDDCGFTLIETIAVLVMIGIVSAVAIAGYSGGSSNLYTVEAALKNHIRHAQSRSMFDDDVLWGIQISDDDDTYWLVQEENGTVTASPQSAWGADVADMIDSGKADTSLLNVDIDNAPGDAIIFNSMGVPFLGSSSGAQLTLTDSTIELQDNNSNNKRTITITPETGFVP